MQIVYLNGRYLPIQEAKISVLDRGFLFADAVYEVIPVFHQQFIGLHQHLTRLKQSLDALSIPPPYSDAKWVEIFTTLVKKNIDSKSELCLYVHVTRGTEESRNFAIPKEITPTVFAQCTPSTRKSLALIQKGFSAVTIDDKRRKDCYIKSTALLPNVLAQHDATQLQADEAIFIRDGTAIESPISNLFIVKHNRVITPELQPQILAGVTRGIILQLAKQQQIPFEERVIPQAELFDADEVWLTGSTKEIYPIVKVDGRAIGDGTPGPIWQRFFNWYQEFKQSHVLATSKQDADNNQPL